MPSRLVTTLTAATLAITTFTAVPAVADEQRDQRAARAIATVLGIAIVGSILNDRRKDRDDRHSQPARQPARTDAHGHNGITHTHDRGGRIHNHGAQSPRIKVQPRPLPRRVSRNLLPPRCLRSFSTREGKVRMFPRRCLERNYSHVNRLPRECFQRIRTRDGKRAGFGARCLRRNGFRLARG